MSKSVAESSRGERRDCLQIAEREQKILKQINKLKIKN